MLEVKKLQKDYGDNRVLKGIDLKVKKGERIAIIGPSGCGKSTFLRCLNMIEKPTNGDVDLSLVRRKIGMVFQQFNLFPHLTVLENIILSPVKLGIMLEKDAKKKAMDLLKTIGLDDKAGSYPGELSGGQMQRVAIVRTLIMEPEIILFDEPTSALDPEMVGEVLDLIMSIADKGITMLLVSHEMNFVKTFATKVLFLDKGEIVVSGDVDEVFIKNKNERLNDFLAKTSK